MRTILDLALTCWMDDLDEIREIHDYCFDVARRHRDVIFGHWLSFNPEIGKDGIREFERAVAADAGFIGFGIVGQVEGGYPASDPIWDPFYKASIDAGVPVLIHCGLTGIGQGSPAARASCWITAIRGISTPSPRDSPSSRSWPRDRPFPGRTT